MVYLRDRAVSRSLRNWLVLNPRHHDAPQTLVYQDLRHAIVSGRYRPGQPLVASRIAQELRVSRAPVTLALKRLQSEGFVQGDPHKINVVSSLSEQRVREIYAMRCALEALALRETAARATVEQIQQLRALSEEYERSVDDAEKSHVLDNRFHRLLREASGMSLLTATLNNLFDQCEYYRTVIKRLRDPSEVQQSVWEHGQIVAAVSARDGDAAARCIVQHIERSVSSLLEYLRRVATTENSHPHRAE